MARRGLPADLRGDLACPGYGVYLVAACDVPGTGSPADGQYAAVLAAAGQLARLGLTCLVPGRPGTAHCPRSPRSPQLVPVELWAPDDSVHRASVCDLKYPPEGGHMRSDIATGQRRSPHDRARRRPVPGTRAGRVAGWRSRRCSIPFSAKARSRGRVVNVTGRTVSACDTLALGLLNELSS